MFLVCLVSIYFFAWSEVCVCACVLCRFCLCKGVYILAYVSAYVRPVHAVCKYLCICMYTSTLMCILVQWQSFPFPDSILEASQIRPASFPSPPVLSVTVNILTNNTTTYSHFRVFVSCIRKSELCNFGVSHGNAPILTDGSVKGA